MTCRVSRVFLRKDTMGSSSGMSGCIGVVAFISEGTANGPRMALQLLDQDIRDDLVVLS